MQDNEDDRKPAAFELSESKDDEDDWSRRVETDETAALQEESFRMESVVEDKEMESIASQLTDPPSRPELSLKERLVLRERQRRIETERARLKRQFALSNHNNSAADNLTGEEGESEAASNREMGSATEGTLGEESTRAHPDEDIPPNEENHLGFNMERFLRNSDTFDPQLETTYEERPTLMERFLSDPVVIQSDDHHQTTGDDVQRSVSFDVLDGNGIPSVSGVTTQDANSRPIPTESLVSFGESTNASTHASIEVETGDDVAREPFTPMTSMDVNGVDDDSDADGDGVNVPSTPATRMTDDVEEEPRVLRLTEADMQEMAAIDEVSIGNAPPSEREEEMLSEIGELADFGGSGGMGRGLNSTAESTGQETPTTAQESASLVSGGNHSARLASISTDRDHLDGVPIDSFLSQHSPRANNIVGTVAVNSISAALSSNEDVGGVAGLESAVNNGRDVAQPMLVADDDGDNHLLNGSAAETGSAGSETLVNRVLRPGMIMLRPSSPPDGLKAPPQQVHMPTPVVVDNFDFDKDAPSSPLGSNSAHGDSYRDLPPDVWSPPGKMQVSPINTGMRNTLSLASPDLHSPSFPPPISELGCDSPGGTHSLPCESTPLLMNKGHHHHHHGDESVPPVIETPRNWSENDARDRDFHHEDMHHARHNSMVSTFRSLVSDLRSEEDSSKEVITNESEFYLESSMFARAFPERLFALTVTLIFEIPVLLMISGGSDALCQLIGRSRYQLLMGFIPLTSAISGNVGLQASTLTTRAISHCHVTSSTYLPWFLSEVGAACYLGIGMGTLLSSIAYFASHMDFAFGFTIFIAQFTSIVTAGITGTFAPLLFSFIFKRDSGKWGGPLETAIQDIVGSFAMVVMSYQILKFLGPGPIDAYDICLVADTDDSS